RNLYKWEKGLEPWQEPEAADLLDWIDDREHYWQDIAEEPYRDLRSADGNISPYDHERINPLIDGSKVLYGAGYGRSMKPIFFLGEKISQYTVEGCPVSILGTEIAREMASPFAMAQDRLIIIRREPLRYFLWDQMQEMRSSCRNSVQYVLHSYGLQKDGQLDQEMLKAKLAEIVDEETNLFIYHEVGEILQETFLSATLQKIITNFPGSVIELVCRGIKDVLADTHPKGLLAYLIREKRNSSLGLYLAMLDGLRAKLFPEIATGWELFVATGGWQHIEQARQDCWKRHSHMAETITRLAGKIDNRPKDQVSDLFTRKVLTPLGIDLPG
ncbi:MAG: Sfum_1244 family protein, partial [Desulforhopalus sp.]